MANHITKEVMDSRLNFGNLCRILSETVNGLLWVPDLDGDEVGKLKSGIKHEDVVNTMYSLILSNDKLSMLGTGTSRATASRLWTHKCEVQDYIRRIALQNDNAVTLICENFQKRIFVNLKDDQRHNLLVKLQSLILATPEGQISATLKAHIALHYDKTTSELCCMAIAECIYWCILQQTR